jgi:hypothetical protein
MVQIAVICVFEKKVICPALDEMSVANDEVARIRELVNGTEVVMCVQLGSIKLKISMLVCFDCIEVLSSLGKS